MYKNFAQKKIACIYFTNVHVFVPGKQFFPVELGRKRFPECDEKSGI